jgi:hypothetical protein
MMMMMMITMMAMQPSRGKELAMVVSCNHAVMQSNVYEDAGNKGGMSAASYQSKACSQHTADKNRQLACLHHALLV